MLNGRSPASRRPSSRLFVLDTTKIFVPLETVAGYGVPVEVVAEESAVHGVVIYPSSITIEEGSQFVLRATILGGSGADDRISWWSSDSNIVSVFGKGLEALVKGRLEGTASITAKTQDGGFETVCQVTVAEKTVVVYDVLKILRPNFSEVVAISNNEILSLSVTAELSGHYGIDFTLPVGATGWNEIKKGRYIETLGQKFTIEKIRPGRGNDGNPTIEVNCSHILFEIEQEQIPHDTQARASIIRHLQYILRGTGFTVVATESDNEFYQMRRLVEYQSDESRFDVLKKVFNIFGGHYRIDGFNLEIMPPQDSFTTPDLSFEYAVTNKSIEKVEDPSDVVTILYATGGEVVEGADRVTLKRTVYADSEIRALYRRDKIQFISFGDIKVWNNFVRVTDRYIQRHQLARTSYSVSVAELKKITNIESLYPGRDFQIEIGKPARVKDDELGITTDKLIQRYKYKPLEPAELSSVVVGDKPPDITYEEVRREGIIGEIRGEWRYDEETGEWIFFPDDPDIEDEKVGEDYTLDIIEHVDSCGPVNILYRYHTGNVGYEKSTLEIETGATMGGMLTIILNSILHHVEVLEGDTPTQIAEKIDLQSYRGWETSQSGNVVIFTATEYGSKEYSATYRFGLTGAEGSFLTVKGRLDAETSDWLGASLPFSKEFAQGDTIDVICQLEEPEWYFLGEFTGHGLGSGEDKDDPRIFYASENMTAQVKVVSTGASISVMTWAPVDTGLDETTLFGEVVDLGKYGQVERGFVWAFGDYANLTVDNYVGRIDVDSGAKGEFSAILERDENQSDGTTYYYRAFAKAYDEHCGEDVIGYGPVREVTFRALGEYIVKVDWVMESGAKYHSPEDHLDFEPDLDPWMGTGSVVENTELTFDLRGVLPEGAEFSFWRLTNKASGSSINYYQDPITVTITEDMIAECFIKFPAYRLIIAEEDITGEDYLAGEAQIAYDVSGDRVAYRLPMDEYFSRPVYVWLKHDEELDGVWRSGGESVSIDGEMYGDGYQPRYFPAPETYGVIWMTIGWEPDAKICQTRCIFIEQSEPDPNIGKDGDIWIRYLIEEEEEEGEE